MKSIGLKPLNDRVVVQPDEAIEVSEGGIVLPDTAQETPSGGRVLAIGNGTLTNDGERIPLTVQVGDTVIYSKYAGSEIEVEGETVKVLREDDILAVCE